MREQLRTSFVHPVESAAPLTASLSKCAALHDSNLLHPSVPEGGSIDSPGPISSCCLTPNGIIDVKRAQVSIESPTFCRSVQLSEARPGAKIPKSKTQFSASPSQQGFRKTSLSAGCDPRAEPLHCCSLSSPPQPQDDQTDKTARLRFDRVIFDK